MSPNWAPSSAQLTVAALALAVICFVYALYRAACLLAERIQYVGKDEQVLVKRLTEKVVVNGPCVYFPPFLTTLKYTKRKAVVLNETQYAVAKDASSGSVRVLVGPSVTFLSPYEAVEGECPRQAHVLSANDGLHVNEQKTGELTLYKGPRTFVPAATEEVVSKVRAIALSRGEFVRMRDRLTGREWVERGETLLWPEPHHVVTSPKGNPEAAYALKANQYVRLRDKLTGAVRAERGEKLVFPTSPSEILADSSVMNAIDLRPDQYTVVQDQASGRYRVERGPALVWLGPLECVIGEDKQFAVNVDAETAALVRDRRTGEQTLVTERQLFVPGEHEEVVEARPLIRLADNEAMVLKDEAGVFHFRYGDPSRGTPRSFFLPPHWSVNELRWSRGRRRERRDLAIRIFDMRPQYMSFEFNTRTSDNVELVLEGTFFWEVVDLGKMLRFTGDAPGDICSHARSAFIQLVSKVTLAEFMDTFNAIAAEAHRGDDTFYSQRGIAIHSLEVTRYQCADQSTARILEQIIAETTNRLNRLSCQESENEVALARLRGELEVERASSEVLEVRRQHAVESAQAEGAAEAERCAAFLATLADKVPTLGRDGAVDDGEAALDMWRTLRRGEALSSVANGNAHVVFAPQDAKLSFDKL